MSPTQDYWLKYNSERIYSKHEHRSIKPFRDNYLLSVGGLCLLLAACLLLLTGCPKPCVKSQLPIEPQPILREVRSVGASDPNALICFSEENARNILENIAILQNSLDKCNISIVEYNKTVKE